MNLAVNGEVDNPHSALGEHVNACWEELSGPSERSLVHWLRRLVFRGAWLDQRVKEGELEVVFDETTSSFGYAQPDRDFELIELSPEPSWPRVAYRRLTRGSCRARTARPRARCRCRPPSLAVGREHDARGRQRARWSSPPLPVATTVSEPPSSVLRARAEHAAPRAGGRARRARRSSRPRRRRARRCRFARSTAISAICAEPSGGRSKPPPATARPSARFHSVTSSGRTPASTTGTSSRRPSKRRPPPRAAGACAPAPGGPPIATREPFPNGSRARLRRVQLCAGRPA